MANIIDITVRAKDQSKAGLSSAEKSTGKVKSALAGIGTVAGGIVAAGAITKIGDAITSSFQAADDWNKAQGQTNAVLHSTQGAAHVTAQHVRDLAGQIENYSTFSDGAIQSGENMLLTFTNIRNEAGKGNDIFDQATKTLADYSQATGTDAKDAAVQLGKALQDPIKGVGALQRVGVQFTDQQKEQIKKMVESGDTMGAQKLILHELGKEFGGSAKAAGDTQPYKKLSNKLSDVGRSIALQIMPMITSLADWANNHMGIVKALGAVAAAIGGLLIAAKVAKAIQTLGSAFSIIASGPVGLIIAALAAIGFGLYEAWTHSAKFRDIVENVFSVVGRVVLTFAEIWLTEMQTVSNIFMDVVGAIIHGAAAAFGWVPGVGPKLRGAAAEFDKFHGSVNNVFDAAHKKIEGWKTDLANMPKVAKLKGDISDLNSKIADAKRKLADPHLTNPQKTKLRGDISDLQWKVIQAQNKLNALNGKTVTTYINTKVLNAQGSYGYFGYAGGGPVGAAAGGGPRANRVMVGENGPEIVDLPTGSFVHPSANSHGMMRGGGVGQVVFELAPGGDEFDKFMLQWLRNKVRVKGGGNVQVAFGR